MCWQSRCPDQRCPESAALSEAQDRAEYARVVFAEMLGHNINETMTANWIPCYYIVDAKSLYDLLNKQGSLPQERRVALDILATREAVQREHDHVRWAPTRHLLADVLTKKMARIGPYTTYVLQRGRLCIMESEEARNVLQGVKLDGEVYYGGDNDKEVYYGGDDEKDFELDGEGYYCTNHKDHNYRNATRVGDAANPGPAIERRNSPIAEPSEKGHHFAVPDLSRQVGSAYCQGQGQVEEDAENNYDDECLSVSGSIFNTRGNSTSGTNTSGKSGTSGEQNWEGGTITGGLWLVRLVREGVLGR